MLQMPEPILSASQITAFNGCNRLWGFKYLSGLLDEAGPSAAHGKNVHAKLEDWLKNGIMPKGQDSVDKVARAMLKAVPNPVPKVPRTEEAFTFEVDGVKYRGFIDAVWLDDNTTVIRDWKTTSGLQWAKSEETLRSDVQAILYARYVFQDADVVDLEWVYGTRETTPRTLVVRLNITFEEVQRAMVAITATAKRILALYAENPDPNTLDYNLERCGALGGCPFTEACNITAADRVRGRQRQHNTKEQKAMGFRDRLKKEVIDTTGTTVAESTEPKKVSMRERLSGVAPPPFTPAVTRDPVAQGVQQADAGQQVLDAPADGVEAEQLGAALKKGRGRKPGSKNKPKGVTEEVVVDMVADTIPAPTGGDFILLVNCFSDLAPIKQFSDIVRPVLEAVQEREGVADYRLIDFKGPGMLAAALFTFLQDNPQSGRIMLDARTDEGKHCLPTMERFAKEVIRGY